MIPGRAAVPCLETPALRLIYSGPFWENGDGKSRLEEASGILAMSLAFTVGFVAYGTRAMNAAILQVPKDLEEAAYVSGAARWRTVWRIFYPLMLPASPVCGSGRCSMRCAKRASR